MPISLGEIISYLHEESFRRMSIVTLHVKPKIIRINLNVSQKDNG